MNLTKMAAPEKRQFKRIKEACQKACLTHGTTVLVWNRKGIVQWVDSVLRQLLITFEDTVSAAVVNFEDVELFSKYVLTKHVYGFSC